MIGIINKNQSLLIAIIAPVKNHRITY